ncbi:MAG: sigma-54 dependent transcriptional regulator [Spirochaetales bacterium]
MRILIVDDEKQLALSLKDYFDPDGIEADIALDGATGRQMLEEQPYDVLVSDLRMPGLDGMQLLRWVREEGPNIPVIMISAHGEIRDAVEAMKTGAYDYLVKPFDPDELLIRIRKAVENHRLALSFKAGMSGKKTAGEMIGESQKIKEAIRILGKAALSSATILLTGESGTGKEVAARLVHNLSKREGPFVPINMGAFPEHLLESELFGYEKGAFTGADSRKQGLFESAQGGTLFLDEIAELPLHLQVKLLRVLQERKVQRLGSLKGTPIDVRIVAATNRDLEKEVQLGHFREDLYYRINVIRIRLPALRERRDDIPLLAGAFLARFSSDMGRKVDGLSRDAIDFLMNHDFPGNVRELENAIERACILTDSDTLQPRDFDFITSRSPRLGQEKDEKSSSPPNVENGGGSIQEERSGSTGVQGAKTLEEMEKLAIREALARNGNHREKTAAELGITRRTLLNKIKDYGIEQA